MMTKAGRAGDETFAAFVAERSGRLIAQAELLCGDRERARDIVQDVLTRAYPRWHRIEHDDPYGYLSRAVANAVTDWWRRAHRRRERLVETTPETAGMLDHAAASDDRHTLRAALQSLTWRERSVVVLRYLHDYSERQVAEILEISVGTVKSSCHKSLRKLRVALEADPAAVAAAPGRPGLDGKR